MMVLSLIYVITFYFLCWSYLGKYARKAMIFITGRVEVLNQENNAAKNARQRLPGDLEAEECPLCLEVIGKKGVFSLCSHFYCSTCIVRYIRQKQD